MNYFPEKPWNTGDTFVNDTTNVTYKYDGVKWVPVSNDADLGDFVEKAGDTMTGRLNLKYDYVGIGPIDLGGERIITSNGNRPTGNFEGTNFNVWHLDAADATTNPQNEFKVQWDGAQDFIDNNPDEPFALVIDDGGSSQVWITTGTGWITPGNTWHISAAQVLPPTEGYSGVLREGRPVNLYIYGSDNTVDMPYATVLESAVIAAGVAQRVIDQNGDDNADYLPLTGGTITGPLSVNSLLEVGGDKVEYIKNVADITQLSSSEVINAGILSNLMYNPNSGFLAEYATKQYVDDAVADIDLDNLNYLPITGGKLTGDLDVTGFKIKTLDVDSGQNSTLHLKHHGATKVYVGSDVTTFQEKVKLNKEGTEDFHAVTKAYVDNAVGNIDLGNLNYLPITGGELTGALTIRKNTQVALDIIGDSNQSQIKFWSSGAIAIQNYTGFKDNELVTKKYVDDKVAAGGSGFTPGDKVAAASSASAVQGGFYIQNGNLYCKIT